MPHQRFVVLGASGGAGNAIVRALAERGHIVRAVNRAGNATVPDGVERMAADVTVPEDATRAVSGADVVYMAAQPAYHRWVREFPAMLATVIDAAAGNNARLVMVDNLYMYAPDARRIDESTPETATTRKGIVRRNLAGMLRDAHTEGRVAVTIGRASDYFGPGADNSAITALSIASGVEGKPMKWMGRLDRRHAVAYLPDIGRAYALLGESDRGTGATWILPHVGAPTGAGFLAAVNDALPSPVRVGALPASMLRIASPFHAPSRESLEMLYQWTDDFLVDDSRFHTTFGPFDTTPLDRAIGTTVESHRHGRVRIER